MEHRSRLAAVMQFAISNDIKATNNKLNVINANWRIYFSN